jgi:hypothetical protein
MVRSQRGIILLTVLFTLTLVSAYMTVGLTHSLTERNIARRYGDLAQAFQAAEAGIDQALPAVGVGYQGTDANNNETPEPGEWQLLSGGVSYWIGVTNPAANLYQVDARGTSGGIERRIEAVVEPGTGSLPGAAVISAGPLSTDGGTTGPTDGVQVYGDIIAHYTGPETIMLRATKVLASGSASGSVTLAAAPSTPSFYGDAGSLSRLSACVGGACNAAGVRANIDPSFSPLFYWSPSQVVANGKTVALLSKPGTLRQTTVAGTVKVQSAAMTLPPVEIPPLPLQAGSYQTDCTQNFVFKADDNTLGGPLLPAGDYCFRSFSASGPDARLFFVVDNNGNAKTRIYVKRNGGTQVSIKTHARINWSNSPPYKDYTRPAEDLWILVNGTTGVDMSYSHFSGSVYAPQSTVTVESGTGNSTSYWGRIVGNRVVLKDRARNRNFDGGLPPPPPGVGGSRPRIRFWRQLHYSTPA